MLTNKIKNKVKSYLKDPNSKFTKLKISSKHELYLVQSKQKYILKYFSKEYLAGFDRETKALERFQFPEVPKIIFKEKQKNKACHLKPYSPGSQLKPRDLENFKKALKFITKIHRQSIKVTEKEIIDPYIEITTEVKKRLQDLPKKYYDPLLFSTINNFHDNFPEILRNSKGFIHGDFVDRNILVTKKQISIIDWEKSRIAPACEDLIFFTAGNKHKKELITYYNALAGTNYPDKIYNIIDLLYYFRILGSLVRLKKGQLQDYDAKIKHHIKKIHQLIELQKLYREPEFIN